MLKFEENYVQNENWAKNVKISLQNYSDFLDYLIQYSIQYSIIVSTFFIL